MFMCVCAGAVDSVSQVKDVVKRGVGYVRSPAYIRVTVTERFSQSRFRSLDLLTSYDLDLSTE